MMPPTLASPPISPEPWLVNLIHYNLPRRWTIIVSQASIATLLALCVRAIEISKYAISKNSNVQGLVERQCGVFQRVATNFFAFLSPASKILCVTTFSFNGKNILK